MRRLKFLLEKEFKQIVRDKMLPRIIIVLPLIQLIVLPFAANFEMRNINIGFVDSDKSTYSRRLEDKITASGYFRQTDYADSYNTALRSIELDRADVILEIPHDFERRLVSEGAAELFIATNAVNGTKGGLAVSYLGSIIESFNAEIRAEQGITGTRPIVEITTIERFNPHLDYKIYMVPGIIVFLLSILGGFLSALNIVSEKERGTIEQINVSPISRSIFILGKLIPFWIIGLLVLTIGMGVAWAVYGLTPAGNVLYIYLFAMVYLMAFTGIGLAISNFSDSGQQAMFTAFFFLIIFVLLSGLFTPINSMPDWAKTITLFNPLRYFIEVMRMIYLKGSDFGMLLHHFAVICGFAVIFNVLAVASYRKQN